MCITSAFVCSSRAQPAASGQPSAIQTAAAPVSDAAATLTMQPVSHNNKQAAQKRVSNKAKAAQTSKPQLASAAAAATSLPNQQAGIQQANGVQHAVEEQPAAAMPLQAGAPNAANASAPPSGEPCECIFEGLNLSPPCLAARECMHTLKFVAPAFRHRLSPAHAESVIPCCLCKLASD